MSIITCRSHHSRAIPRERRSNEVSFNYVGGSSGQWSITKMTALRGVPLKFAKSVRVTDGPLDRIPIGSAWSLSGIVSNSRYVTREEPILHEGSSPSYRRFDVTCAALIPVCKSTAWWQLARNERREIVDERSRFIATALKFLPAMTRRWRQGSDLREEFDLVTWFEYAPQDALVFDDMLAALRASEEWKYVDREIEIRLERNFD